MSSQDPPEDGNKRGKRQTMESNFLRAKDAVKRRLNPHPRPERPEQSTTLGSRSPSQSLFSHSTPQSATQPPILELDRPSPTSALIPVTQDYDTNTTAEPVTESTTARNTVSSRLTRSLHALERGVELFPPLKSAIGGLIGCLDIVQVGNRSYCQID